MYTILPAKDNPALREKAHDIPLHDIQSVRIRKIIAEMKALLSQEKFGVALAACQIGEPVKLFIVSGRALAQNHDEAPEALPETDAETPTDKTIPEDQVYINPELIKISRTKKVKHEGCLSIRGKWGEVPRAEKATVRAYDENGNRFTRGASGFLAHIFQHEMDHLNGILYTDKVVHLYDEPESRQD